MELSRTDISILIFGIYSLIMGIVLLFISSLVLPLIGMPVSKEPWINLLGFVLICSSYYYLRSAIDKFFAFACYTIHTRITAPLVFYSWLPLVLMIGILSVSVLLTD